MNADAVVPTAHFVKDLGLDSLDVVELGLALEEEVIFFFFFFFCGWIPVGVFAFCR